MTSTPAGPLAPTRWTDPAPVDPSWLGPAHGVPIARTAVGSGPRRAAPSRWRTPLIWGSLVLAAVLLVVVVHALGGFRQRQDQLTPTAVGQTFTAGPYELTLTEATVQYSTDNKIYEVVAIGTARTTADQTMSAAVAGGSFTYAQNLLTRDVQPVDSYSYGDSTDISLRARGLTPGLPPVRLTAEFEFAAKPGDTLRLVVFDQEFSDASIFGDQDPTWNPVSTGHDVRLPLTALPDRKY